MDETEEPQEVNCDEWSLCMDQVHDRVGLEKPAWW